MKIDWNYFIININTEFDNIINTLTQIGDIKLHFDGSKIYTMNNYILEIKENEDYDSNLANELSEVSFLYFKYGIYFTAKNETTLEEQIRFSKKIINKFIENGIKDVQILSEFEHLL